jgi:hypothetical protein
LEELVAQGREPPDEMAARVAPSLVVPEAVVGEPHKRNDAGPAGVSSIIKGKENIEILLLSNRRPGKTRRSRR